MNTSRWLPAGLGALALWSAPAVADHDTWGTFMDAAAGALEDGNQAGAEENLQVASRTPRYSGRMTTICRRR